MYLLGGPGGGEGVYLRGIKMWFFILLGGRASISLLIFFATLVTQIKTWLEAQQSLSQSIDTLLIYQSDGQDHAKVATDAQMSQNTDITLTKRLWH